MSESDKYMKLIGAAGTLGAGPVLKALGKFLPGISHFATGAFSAGYAADQILDFVKEKLESPSARRNRAQLENRADQGVSRPDELANLSNIEQSKSVGNAIGGLGKLAAQAAGGMSAVGEAKEQQAQAQALQERELVEAQKQHQEKIDLQKSSQEQATQRQAAQDQLASIKQQNQEIRNKENMEMRKRSEERAIEAHKHKLGQSAIKSALKKKIPQTHEDVLAGLYELANRAP